MLGKAQNQLLQQVEQAVTEKVPQELRNAFERIVTAGIKVMYSPQTRQMLANQMNQKGDVAEIAGQGVAKLMAILFKESRGTMPMDAGIPAAQVLLCEGLDFLEKSGRVEVSPDLIGAATEAMFAYLLQLFGVSQDKLAQMMDAGAKVQGNQKIEPDGAYRRVDGYERFDGNPSANGIVSSARGGA